MDLKNDTDDKAKLKELIKIVDSWDVDRVNDLASQLYNKAYKTNTNKNTFHALSHINIAVTKLSQLGMFLERLRKIANKSND